MNVLSIIQKLLALRDNNPSEQEAALAAQKIQELLQDHNLTLSEVESHSDKPSEAREKATTNHRAMYSYQQTLMQKLAENNFCLHRISRVFVTTYGKKVQIVDGEVKTGHFEKRHQLVGRAINVQVTQQTYDYLVTALSRAARETLGIVTPACKEGTLFMEGAVARVCERLDELRRLRELAEHERQQTMPHAANALVLADVYGTERDLNNDALNNYPPGTTATNRLKRERERALQQEKHNELVAGGMESTQAWYVSFGYSVEQAAERATSYNRSARGGRGRSTNWTRGNDDRYRKINSASYKAGREAGANIGLHDQVGGKNKNKLLRE